MTPAGRTPPPVLGLVAHPIRWQLLVELARSDRPVRELTALVDEPQNLVSYHLRALRGAGVVTARRSSADGRDSYYAVDLEALDGLLAEATRSLHPGLAPPVAEGAKRQARHRNKPRVLFVCRGNSARSQLAEALLAHAAGTQVSVSSAGSRPKAVHPNVVRVLRGRGIAIDEPRSKHLDTVRLERHDLVVTLCDRVREECGTFAGAPDVVHWSIADPSLEGDDDASTLPAFERTVDLLEPRIRFLLSRLTTSEEPRAR